MKPLSRTVTDSQEIEVYDTTRLYGESGRFRVLQFSGEAIQGALDLDHPRRVVFEYPRAMIHLMEAGNPYYEDVFLIGHGIGTIAGYCAEKRFKVAEVNAQVVELSRSQFGYSQDNVSIGDGRGLLEGEPDHKYDYILLDAFTAAGTPPHLTSLEFFALTRAKLRSGGMMIMNLMGRGDSDRRISAIHTTLSEVYPHTRTFALPAEGSTDVRNIIMTGSSRPVTWQPRHMAGFTEITPELGYVIRD
ncbi:fused MFS/spermidine synthase [Paenibacillus sp. MMS20-IR301]|uniref:spermidine synthase n=1 Tax=Paenibacillus sp. MMS20-IR301 TaxID=2895946 RepID=UPI0028EE9EB6|nr:fused MFS/spermidine synthase [Paenibacillus sp. MMS20-IR301]WNS41417.1 fused MFS/spermidine synthase [Paenibacillus sp. MMS20-IR301]